MSSIPDLERFGALLDFVYRGATEPALWPQVVAAASDWLESPKGMIYTPLHGPDQKGIYYQHGLPADFFELYKARYQFVDMWTEQVVRRKLFTEGNVILGTDLVPHATLVDSQWYADCLRLGDISRLLTSVVFAVPALGAEPQTADLPTACSFYRGRDDADFTEGDRRKLKLLVPHLSRALAVMSRLRQSDMRVSASLASLDKLSIAILLLAGSGEVLFVNRAANAMLTETSELWLERAPTRRGLGRLVAKAAEVNRALARALSTAKQVDHILHFSSVIKVPTAVPGQAWSIQLSRVSPGSAFAADGQMPEVIAFLTDTKAPLDLVPELLCVSYGLTRAQARVALAATASQSIEQLADALSVGVNTVKTHLKHVYEKTGVASRAELVRLLVNLQR
jgi:DNA-binding CsgD family transcriptional regulator